MIHIAHHYHWYDHFDERKIHTEQTPRLGGVAFVTSTLLVTVALLVFLPQLATRGPWSIHALVGLAIGLLIMHWMGVRDDFVNMRAPLKLTFQVASGAVIAFSGITLRVIELPWVGAVSLPPAIATVVTIVWIVSISNAVNLIDGADGLAGGVALFAALFMAFIAVGRGMLLTALVAFALVGSLSAFLLFNVPRAKIFMGDGGSLSTGVLLATLPLLGIDHQQGIGVTVPLFPVLTLLFLPIVDTILAIARRARRRISWYTPDREHIHHLLIDRGFRDYRLLAVVYSTMVVLGCTALAWYAVPAPLQGWLYVGVWAITYRAIVHLRRKDHPSDKASS